MFLIIKPWPESQVLVFRRCWGDERTIQDLWDALGENSPWRVLERHTHDWCLFSLSCDYWPADIYNHSRSVYRRTTLLLEQTFLVKTEEPGSKVLKSTLKPSQENKDLKTLAVKMMETTRRKVIRISWMRAMMLQLSQLVLPWAAWSLPQESLPKEASLQVSVVLAGAGHFTHCWTVPPSRAPGSRGLSSKKTDHLTNDIWVVSLA